MDKLKTFVENARAKGYSDDRIRQSLVRAGWAAEKVDAALATNSQAVAGPEAAAAQPGQSAVALQSQNVDVADSTLENLSIDSDKPLKAQTKKPAADRKTRLRRLAPKAGAALGLLVGLVVLVSGVKDYNHTRVPGGFVITRGQIVFSTPSNKKELYDTRVNFKTADGATHGFVTTTPAGDNNNSKYVAGDGMKVAYYPQNPDVTAMDLTDRGSPATGLAELAAGLLLVSTGGFMLFRLIRRK